MESESIIPVSGYTHINCFDGNHKACDDYYDLEVDICDIGMETFATMAQEMLVDYVRAA